MEATPDPAAAGPYSADALSATSDSIVPCAFGAATTAAVAWGWRPGEEDEDEEDKEEEEEDASSSLPSREPPLAMRFLGEAVSIYL